MIRKVEGKKHLESTGEIYDANVMQEYIDELTQEISKDQLSYDELVKCRVVTVSSLVLSLGTGITAGVVLGKTAFTGACIALATAGFVDALTPQRQLYKRVLRKLNR